MHFQLFKPIITPTEISITPDVIPWSSVWVTKSPRRHEGITLTIDKFWQIFGKTFGFVTDLCD